MGRLNGSMAMRYVSRILAQVMCAFEHNFICVYLDLVDENCTQRFCHTYEYFIIIYILYATL